MPMTQEKGCPGGSPGLVVGIVGRAGLLPGFQALGGAFAIESQASPDLSIGIWGSG